MFSLLWGNLLYYDGHRKGVWTNPLLCARYPWDIHTIWGRRGGVENSKILYKFYVTDSWPFLPNVIMRNTLTSTEREDARSTELMFVTVSFMSVMGLPSPTLSPQLTFDGWQRASESFRCPSVLSAICTMYQNFSLSIVVFIFGCVAKVALKPYSTILALKELSYSRGFDELLI